MSAPQFEIILNLRNVFFGQISPLLLSSGFFIFHSAARLQLCVSLWTVGKRSAASLTRRR